MDYPHQEPDNEPIRPEEYEILDDRGRPIRVPDDEDASPHPVISIAIIVLCSLAFVAANLLMPFLAQIAPRSFDADSLLISLTFSPGNGLLFPGIITHMFAHAGFWHLAFNMLMLYFLGTVVEQRYGPWRYLVLYFGSGLFAALAQAAVNPLGLLLGASGALAGVLAVFVRHYPDARLLIWGILPMPAWMVAVLWIGYNIYSMYVIQHDSAGIAFMAHIAGFLAGIVISLVMFPPGARRSRQPLE